MNFNFFNLPFSRNIIQAFSWTLLHSVWQGLIAAVLAGIILLLTKKSKPVFRYNLLSGLLLILLSASCFTFWYELEKPENSNAKIVYQGFSGIDNVIVTKPGIYYETLNQFDIAHFSKLIINFCSENATLIVTVWLLVFLLKSVRAAAGFYCINQIRHHRIYNVNENWKEHLDKLAKKLGIRKTILLFESGIVNIPMVMGFLKPTILVPAGFLTNLPFSQVEAILLHELAHIRREDYLVNLLQNFAENVFFFNPAILWISSLIREEREHCCDDLAIGIMQNKSSFVNALVSFQEYKSAGSAHVVAFAGKRNHLLDRIKRIIYNNNKQLDAMEKLFVTASLFTVAALSLAFFIDPIKVVPVSLPVQKSEQIIVPIQKPDVQVILKDTVPVKITAENSSTSESTIHVTKNNKRYEIEQKNGEITELKIDGQLIPKEKIESYESEIEPILEEIKDNQQAEADREEAEDVKERTEAVKRESNEAGIDAEEAKKDAENFQAQAKEIRKQAEVIKMNAEKYRVIEGEIFQVSANEIKNSAENIRKQAEVFQKNAEVTRVSAEKFREQAQVIQKQAEVIRKEADKARADFEKMQERLINDLIKEDAIKDRNNLSYKLSDSELIVNGVKQPDALHKKIKAKYLKDAGVELVYNWKGKSGSTTYGIIHTK